MQSSTTAYHWEPLSPSWRLNTSTHKPLELSLSLRALRYVVGMIDPEVSDVGFNSYGESYTTKNPSHSTGHIIRIDPTPALCEDKFPIPPEQFDIMVGYAIHEACHVRARSNSLYSDVGIWQALRMSWGGKISMEFEEILSKYYHHIQIVGEEVYVDNLANRLNPMYYQYIHRARMQDRHIAEALPDTKWNDPFDAWQLTGFYGILPPSDTPELTQKALAIFAKVQQQLVARDLTVEKRRMLYAWAAVEYHKLTQTTPPPPSAPQQQSLQQQSSPEATPTPSDSDSDSDSSGNPLTPEDGQQQSPDDAGDSNKNPPEVEKEEQDASNGGTNGPISEPEAENESLDEPDDTSYGEGYGEGPGDEQQQDTPDFPSPPQSQDDLQPLDNQLHTVNIPLPLHPGNSISPKLQEQLSQISEQQVEDITQQLQQLVEQSYEDNTITPDQYSGSLYALKAPALWKLSTNEIQPNAFDEDTAKELQWVEQFKTRRSRRIYRSQDSGSVDETRLWRGGVPKDGKVFKQRRNVELQELDLVILLDASGSMKAKRGVYNISNALHKAIPESRIISYQGGTGDPAVMELISEKHGPLRRIHPNNVTPSGVALLSTAMKYPNSLIVHFTDGSCNDGLDTPTALKLIEHTYPKCFVVNIEYPKARTQGMFKNAVVQELQDLEDFPKQLAIALGHWQPGLSSILKV